MTGEPVLGGGRKPWQGVKQVEAAPPDSTVASRMCWMRCDWKRSERNNSREQAIEGQGWGCDHEVREGTKGMGVFTPDLCLLPLGVLVCAHSLSSFSAGRASLQPTGVPCHTTPETPTQ